MRFDKVVKVRLSKPILKDARSVIRHNRNKFDSLSHYVRAAVIRANREYASGRLK
jgi:Arc/MetJ-type ribon-helix-helix transcriptional regulator